MNLDRALQLTTAALAITGALFLGLGNQTYLPLALAGGAVASVVLANLAPWLKLNKFIANGIALAAVVWSMRNFFGRIGSEGQLLAIADMLVYLQIVLLFQQKTGRVYWQLLVLSLLQVVVAAALSLGPQFGLLLAFYMVLALLTLVLLCLHEQLGAGPAFAGATSAAGLETSVGQRLLADPELLPSASAATLASSLALASRPALVARQVTLLSLATLLFAAVFFGATPRLGERDWGGGRSKISPTSGFAPEINLEESGRILENNQIVMRATFTRLIDQRPYPLLGEPYFLGAVLTDYVPDQAGNRWVPARRRISRYFPMSDVRPPPLSPELLIRQDVALENANPHTIFSVLPVQGLSETPRELRYDPHRSRIVRTPRSDDLPLHREYRYAFATPALRNGRHLRGTPHANPALNGQDEFLLEMERADLARFDYDRFPQLAEAASAVLARESLGGGTQFEQALALERHFQAPGLYRYSLVFDFKRDKSLDPIEDFVANHRTGHCEYFASALVLMLRSQGIPARIVNGYKGGDYNTLGKYYLVRERHAHAWVEALLPAGEVPAWEIAGEPSGGGTWYRLDPTPAAPQQVANAQDDGFGHSVVDAFDYVELLWRDYVLSLNSTRQQDTLYEPVSSRALGFIPPWLDTMVSPLSRGLRMLGLSEKSDAQSSDAARVFDLSTAFIPVLLLATLAGLLQLGLFLWRRWGRRGGQRQLPGEHSAGPPLFYRRLEALLAQLQVRREAGQTARELARQAEVALAGGGPQVAALPAEIVGAYYRVRFGGAALDKTEIDAIEHALAQLIPAVHRAKT
ncbi:MAG: DUF3488 and transglutaminase-like domain-containing protein [Pirellulaceae bacterium]|nr:DUF3488 and transglutaminase-like domain-containing protein [Pirellulaceae bacterium]